MRTLTYTVTPQDDGRAVRSVVPRRFALGTHIFRRLKVQGGVLVNGETARASRVLHAGDVVTLLLPDEAPEGTQADAAPAGPAASQDDAPSSPAPRSAIRYADEDLLIVAKPAPLATLPGAHIAGETLREQLAALLGLSPSGFAYRPVNRLDKGTSGLLAVARHAHAQRLLSAQLHTPEFVREYLAVVEGVPEPPEGVIDAPILRPGAGVVRVVDARGQPAVTHYRVERSCGGRSLVRLRLQTGRTHQIRVHMAHIGCPIVGDYLYGTPSPALPGRFALHSAYLACRQPITLTRIEITEPLPPELAALLDAD